MNDSNEDASTQPQRKPGTGTVTRAKPRCFFFFSIVPLLNLARKSYSKELFDLVVELDEIISFSESYQKNFRHAMVYVCSAHNIEWLPQTRDSLPTASDLLFLVESKLPRLGWDETKIAELLGISAKETDLHDMHKKFLAFREKLAGKTCASGPGLDKDSNAGMIKFFVWQRLFLL